MTINITTGLPCALIVDQGPVPTPETHPVARNTQLGPWLEAPANRVPVFVHSVAWEPRYFARSNMAGLSKVPLVEVNDGHKGITWSVYPENVAHKASTRQTAMDAADELARKFGYVLID